MKYCKMFTLILILGILFWNCNTQDKIKIEGIWAIDTLRFTKPRANANNELNSNLIVFNKDGTCHFPAFYWQEEKIKNVLDKVSDSDNIITKSGNNGTDIDLDNAPDQDGRWLIETKTKVDILKIDIGGNFFSRVYTISFFKDYTRKLYCIKLHSDS